MGGEVSADDGGAPGRLTLTPTLPLTPTLTRPAKCLFPALDLLRLLLLLPAAAPHVQAAQPPLLLRLAGMLGPSADKPTTLMVLRCFANALHCAQLRPLAAEVRAGARLGLGLGLGL